MKTFEIEVVRTYTTTIEVELPDNLSPSAVERITLGNTVEWDTKGKSFEDDLYHEEFKSFNEAPYGQDDE